MPKLPRKMDPLFGETSVRGKNHTSSSASSSPLVPQLTIHMSPQHTEESNEVAQINSPGSRVFQLASEEPNNSDLEGPTLLSPSSLLSSNSNLVKLSVLSSPRKRKASPGLVGVPLYTKGKENSLLLDSDNEETSDQGFGSLQLNSNSASFRETDEMKTNECKSKTDSFIDKGKTSKKGHPAKTGSQSEDVSGDKSDVSEDKSGVSSPIDEALEGGRMACSLTGYVTVTARNGDSLVHGMLPTVMSHHQGAAFNSCFPGSDGNWYQIISASVPPLLTSQQGTENSSNSLQTVTHPSNSSVCTVSEGNNILSSISVAQTSISSTGVSSTTTAADPLLSFLQQYSAGAASTSDVQTSLPALHLPLGLTATAAVGSTPRYICATNPRTGQLLILSSVGHLAGAQAVQQPQQQQLPLQQQLPHQQVLPAYQQQVKASEKTQWKSPLVSSSANGLNVKESGKSASLISQLLQNKIPSSSSQRSGIQDENMPPVAAAQELLALASPTRTRPAGQGTVPPPLFHSSPDQPSDEPVRENHNMKERRRRARIKEACDLMRQLVPGMSEKTDKATVFEFSARYIHFLKNFVGTHHDKDFLIKYSPY